ncbi:MAG: PD-(D/E)XK nuclease family protein [Bacteroidota bacterium]
MKIFLKEVASLLLNEYGNKLDEHCIVFPNNRSILFFRKYMSELIGKPIFMPSLHTISSLLSARSDLKQAENVQLVFELYKIYLEASKRKESFDEFYYWGEMLINDFDDIDKYLVDPELLFANLADLKEIDEKFGTMSEDITTIIRQFWLNFEASNMTDEKSDFLTVWQILASVYRQFTGRLKEKGLAYEGMIIREQTEIIKSRPEEWCEDIKMFHFVGFNALNKCEKEILRSLKKSGKGSFYWDYDPWYVLNRDHEAGYFIRQNIAEFPAHSAIAPTESPCSIDVYSAPSDVAQAKLIPSLINDFELSDDPNNTAIILADENMLTPVLNSLPETVNNINVTMGYPLFQTPVYSLVHQLLNLQKNRRGRGDESQFYYNNVINVLQHQYVMFNQPADSESVIKKIKERNLIRINRQGLLLNELFKLIFAGEFNSRTYLQEILAYLLELLGMDEDTGESKASRLSLQQEYIYRLILPLNQLGLIMDESGMDPGIELYTRLIDRMMRKIVIPFSGEPLQGVQVMGILETRSLDFKNIIFLSANEGKIPRSPMGNSYIPYNLREAFGLPTIKHSDSIYAYYLYRLLQRAEKVKFVYNSSTEGTRSGEMSRYLLQLKYDDRYDASFMDTRFDILPQARVKDSIVRTNEIYRILESTFYDDDRAHYLSPSGINTWITCNMKFYYRYIAGIEEKEDILEEVDYLAFGNILHHVMKEIYQPYKRRIIGMAELEHILHKEAYIKDMAEEAFRKVFMKSSHGSIKGKNLVITSIIERMAKQILKADQNYIPFEVVALEKKFKGSISFVVDGETREAKIGGTIDRVDMAGGLYRVLDYKSGTDELDIKSLEDLFNYDSKTRNSAAFQTLLYCEMFTQNMREAELRPSLYPVRKIFSDNFSDAFKIKNGPGKGDIESYRLIRAEFTAGLQNILADIFDRNRDIKMTSDRQKCRYCPYNILCNRKA